MTFPPSGRGPPRLPSSWLRPSPSGGTRTRLGPPRGHPHYDRLLGRHRRRLPAHLTECPGLAAEYEVESWAELGQNEFVHQLPGRISFTPVTLTR